MKKLILFLFVIIQLNQSKAQNPLVKVCDKSYGGNKLDLLKMLNKTFDGGYILGGLINSDSGGTISSVARGAYDFWIVKVDSSGNKEWDKRFGCDRNDDFTFVLQTKDKGFILTGSSESGICADKSQPAKNGNYNCWIIKVDSLGNKEWDKTYGDSKGNGANTVVETNDGGYLVGGIMRTDSWDSDFWIIKLDRKGNKLWDRHYGGNKSDNLRSLIKTSDNAYLLAGNSDSDSSGNKSQNTYGDSITYFDWSQLKDTTIFVPSFDYWIIKIDSEGNKLWDRRFGGNENEELGSVQQTIDNGFILAGITSSKISGDKSQESIGKLDYWIIKIDSMGNKQWDMQYGGIENELDVGSVCQTVDSGYLIAGRSWSPKSGDKTEDNLGTVQTWIIKINIDGKKQWDKTIFTPGYDNVSPTCGFAMEVRKGIYAVANSTNADIGGYKSQPKLGGYDFWLLKFKDTTFITSVDQAILPQNSFTLYPNPAANEITLYTNGFQSTVLEYTIINVYGQIISDTLPLCLENGKATFDISNVNNGLYFLQIKTQEGYVVLKFIKEKLLGN